MNLRQTGSTMLCLASVLIAAAGCSSPARSGQGTIGSETPTALVEKVFSHEGVVGGLVLVRRHGHVQLLIPYGYADTEHTRRVGPHTIFDLGSVTKSFTAVAIRLLIEEHRMRLSDRLDRFIPELTQAHRLTVAQLLEQRSGLPEYDTAEFQSAVLQTNRAGNPQSSILRKLATMPLTMRPGERFEYSNTNYFLLGIVVQRVTGRTLDEFVRERFAAPLSTDEIFIGDESQASQIHSKSYSFDGYQYQELYPENKVWAGGAGAISASAQALALWDESLFAGRLISQASLREIQAPISRTESSAYGEGFVRSRVGKHVIVWHDGAIGGFRAYHGVCARTGDVMVVLANTSTADVETLAIALWKRILT